MHGLFTDHLRQIPWVCPDPTECHHEPVNWEVIALIITYQLLDVLQVLVEGGYHRDGGMLGHFIMGQFCVFCPVIPQP